MAMNARVWAVSLLLSVSALADAPVAEAPKQDVPANDIAAKLSREAAKHERRMAKITRLEQLAAETAKPELGEKAKMLRDKEQRRHDRVLARLNDKPKENEGKKDDEEDKKDNKGKKENEDKKDKKEKADKKDDEEKDEDGKKGNGKGKPSKKGG